MTKYTIDNQCQNCGACRLIAPEYFGDSDGYSYIKEQPTKELVEKIGCHHIVEVNND